MTRYHLCIFLPWLLLFIHLTLSQPPIILKSATLTPDNTNFNGASIMTNYQEVTNFNNTWNANIKTEDKWQFILILDNSWGFYQNIYSSIKITFNSPSTDTASSISDWLIMGITTDNAEFISTLISLNNFAHNQIYPQCDTTTTPTQMHGIGDIASLLGFDRSCDVADGSCGNWNDMLPINLPNYPNTFPFTLQLDNDPLTDSLHLSFSTKSYSTEFQQKCGYISSPTNKGLKVYIGGDDIGQSFKIKSIQITSFLQPNKPSTIPTNSPTVSITNDPIVFPSNVPTVTPINPPTIVPSHSPTYVPPTISPTLRPSITPSLLPTIPPSISPTTYPTMSTTVLPTYSPSVLPSNPSNTPSLIPTPDPSTVPTFRSTTLNPTVNPSNIPTVTPSHSPSFVPTVSPTFHPSNTPTLLPSLSPSNIPSSSPSIKPTSSPTVTPTFDVHPFPVFSSINPTNGPSISPIFTPTMIPTSQPTSFTITKQPTSTIVHDNIQTIESTAQILMTEQTWMLDEEDVISYLTPANNLAIVATSVMCLFLLVLVRVVYVHYKEYINDRKPSHETTTSTVTTLTSLKFEPIMSNTPLIDSYFIRVHCDEKQLEYTLLKKRDAYDEEEEYEYDWDENTYYELTEAISNAFSLQFTRFRLYQLEENIEEDINDIDDIIIAFDCATNGTDPQRFIDIYVQVAQAEDDTPKSDSKDKRYRRYTQTVTEDAGFGDYIDSSSSCESLTDDNWVQIIKTCQKIIRTTTENRPRYKAYKKLGFVEERRGNMQKAMKYYRRALNEECDNDLEEKVLVLMDLPDVHLDGIDDHDPSKTFTNTFIAKPTPTITSMRKVTNSATFEIYS